MAHQGATPKKRAQCIKLAVGDQTARQESTIESSDISLEINLRILVVHIEPIRDGWRSLRQGAENLLLNRFSTHSARCDRPELNRLRTPSVNCVAKRSNKTGCSLTNSIDGYAERSLVPVVRKAPKKRDQPYAAPVLNHAEPTLPYGFCSGISPLLRTHLL
jgi:hypothetical protein